MIVNYFGLNAKSATKVQKKNDIHNSVCHFFEILLLLLFFVLCSSVCSEKFLLYVRRNELIAIERHGEGSASAGERRESRGVAG